METMKLEYVCTVPNGIATITIHVTIISPDMEKKYFTGNLVGGRKSMGSRRIERAKSGRNQEK